jgi:hypothetical protein
VRDRTRVVEISLDDEQLSMLSVCASAVRAESSKRETCSDWKKETRLPVRKVNCSSSPPKSLSNISSLFSNPTRIWVNT